MAPKNPIILYGFKKSGHSHRAELMLRLLDVPFEFREVDLARGEQKTEAFLKLNAFGQVPVIDDGGVIIPDSSAILVYLAKKYDPAGLWLPEDVEAAAKIQRWLSVAQGPLINGPARARLFNVFKVPVDHAQAKDIAEKLFATLEQALRGASFLIGSRATIADVALYTYTAHGPEGGVSLDPNPNIRAWLSRVEALPKFAPMPATKIGLAA
ncbi:glutathione S-transferase (plasmid) [Methylocystis sp. MJC1]|uniref:glutathione S-transferase family protein n=1 Tax=Methylocystis sp. MJC1 TaxID=2654282 RepID=UPI0013EDAB77|nr:glutathione S-transferase [Methylocystis sp. MJC1]KAF2988967.1 Maleylpyruvate isomerase [Methylocystis sp. MJC1]MBU6529267.1 glutathione S-transferase family protein [Methylocystis sp. MJC1]UZX13939.1 glutathione S-transferase [Methylocystis sp. MJC1]